MKSEWEWGWMLSADLVFFWTLQAGPILVLFVWVCEIDAVNLTWCRLLLQGLQINTWQLPCGYTSEPEPGSPGLACILTIN